LRFLIFYSSIWWIFTPRFDYTDFLYI